MLQLFLAFWGSIFPAILFNINKKYLFWVGLSGLAGWGVYMITYGTTDNVIMATFAGSFAVGIYSESMARIFRAPASIFSVGGMFPLVPGISAYITVQLIVENSLSKAASKGIETVASAGVIALGIMLASVLFRINKKLSAAR